MSNDKTMDIWTAVQTVLTKNPGLKAQFLIPQLREKTGLSRSTVFGHLDRFVEQDKINRKNAHYWLKQPEHPNEKQKNESWRVELFKEAMKRLG